jgi:Leucine-rich repeat (LRR) protein
MIFYLAQLPDCFGLLKKLENIQLNQNQLQSLPSSFANLSGLRQLNLANNRFTSIPEAILKLPNLQLIDLSSNQISQISDHIQTIQVDELNLNDNRVEEFLLIYFYFLLFLR